MIEVDAVDGVAVDQVIGDGHQVIVKKDRSGGAALIAGALHHIGRRPLQPVVAPEADAVLVLQLPVKMGRVGCRGHAAAVPDGVDIEIGVELDVGGVRLVHEIGQRIKGGVRRRIAKVGAADPLRPRLEAGRVVGVGGAADLEIDGVEAGIGGVGDDFVDLGPRRRLAIERPVEARDPEGAHFVDKRLRLEDGGHKGAVATGRFNRHSPVAGRRQGAPPAGGGT